MAYGFAEMAEQRADLSRIIGEIDSQLRRATRSVHAFSQEWQGEARDAFDGQYREWTGAAADMLANLAYLHRLMGLAHANYGGADKAVLTVWGGEG